MEHKVYIKAYIPEHIVSLMQIISKAEPYLEDSFLYFKKDRWIMFVGYPLEGDLNPSLLSLIINRLITQHDLEYLWIIAPEIPEDLKQKATEFQDDHYYTLDLKTFNPKRRLIQDVERASGSLNISHTRYFTGKHKQLVDEFVKSKKPSPYVKALYHSMNDYLSKSDTALLQNAYSGDELVAFYCLETGAKGFLTYLMGCHSESHYIPHASDVLFMEMVDLAKKIDRQAINLGLGVNSGIRRFKEKWGGKPTIPYQFMEWKRGFEPLRIIKSLESIL